MPPRKKLIKLNADTYVDENDFFARAKTPDSLKRKACAESLARAAGRAAKIRLSDASTRERAPGASSPLTIEFSEKVYALSAPAILRRRRATPSLDECACALCEEPLRDVQRRSYEVLNPWLLCQICERPMHARCAKVAGVLSNDVAERRSARFVCQVCRVMGPKTLAF